jgi:hypothetical protein
VAFALPIFGEVLNIYVTRLELLTLSYICPCFLVLDSLKLVYSVAKKIKKSWDLEANFLKLFI